MFLLPILPLAVLFSLYYLDKFIYAKFLQFHQPTSIIPTLVCITIISDLDYRNTPYLVSHSHLPHPSPVGCD